MSRPWADLLTSETHSAAFYSCGESDLRSCHEFACLACRIMGVVTHTDKRGAYVDVGGKMSAFIQTDDITLGPLQKVWSFGRLLMNFICSTHALQVCQILLPAQTSSSAIRI